MHSKPDTIVAVIVQNDRFLIIRRGSDVSDADYWAPLSGKVESGESQESAVIREVSEEVGLDVEPLEKVWECVSASGTHQLHWWLARPVGSEIQPDPREVAEAHWLTAAEFTSLDRTFPCDQEFFHSVLPGLARVRAIVEEEI